MNRRSFGWLGVAAALSLVVGCSPSEEKRAETDGGPAKLQVTATVGMIADLARRIGGERVDVTMLMGPGVDPHLYKASEGDLRRLGNADVVLYNGLFLEGKIGGALAQVAERGKLVVAVAEKIDESKLFYPDEYEGHPDPHVWFDVSLWIRTVPQIVEAMAMAAPASESYFKERAAAVVLELEQLHLWCREQIASIPKERRVLITAHDAFGYFGRAYDIEVVGLQGLSTATEFGLKDVQRIVDLVTERGIRAVFVESSVPRRSIEAVVQGCKARGHDVTIGGELYSDAMGEEGTAEGTYVGMVRSNVETIVGALR